MSCKENIFGGPVVKEVCDGLVSVASIEFVEHFPGWREAKGCSRLVEGTNINVLGSKSDSPALPAPLNSY